MAYIRSGGAGAEKPTLLWTNPNPNVEMGDTTVSLDLSEYEYVIIRARLFVNNLMYNYQIIPLNVDYIIGMSAYSGDSENPPCSRGYAGSYYRRSAKVTTSGVQFGTGEADGRYNNSACIPEYIYGLKTLTN